jgi:hypothetical protein
MNSEQLMQFLQENWWVLALAVIALIIVVKVVKTVVKWVVVIAILVFVAVYSGYTIDDLKKISDQVVAGVSDGAAKVIADAAEEAVKTMTAEAKEAKYTSNADGSFTIKTKSLELTGKPNDTKVTLLFKGEKIVDLDINDTIQSFIDTARTNAK